jgi:hypothetical protein
MMGKVSLSRQVMRAGTLLGCLLSALGVAQSTYDLKINALGQRHAILGTEPHRRDAHPRRENISDEEVREVQRAAMEVYPDAIVNISTVMDECECEVENCTAQVWLVLYHPGRTTGFMLSMIDGHWQVGAVQKWWLRYNDHRNQYLRWSPGAEGRQKERTWWVEEVDLLSKFPGCANSAGSPSVLVAPKSTANKP